MGTSGVGLCHWCALEDPLGHHEGQPGSRRTGVIRSGRNGPEGGKDPECWEGGHGRGIGWSWKGLGREKTEVSKRD